MRRATLRHRAASWPSSVSDSESDTRSSREKAARADGGPHGPQTRVALGERRSVKPGEERSSPAGLPPADRFPFEARLKGEGAAVYCRSGMERLMRGGRERTMSKTSGAGPRSACHAAIAGRGLAGEVGALTSVHRSGAVMRELASPTVSLSSSSAERFEGMGSVHHSAAWVEPLGTSARIRQDRKGRAQNLDALRVLPAAVACSESETSRGRWQRGDAPLKPRRAWRDLVRDANRKRDPAV